MKIKKRIISVFLALAFVFSLFACEEYSYATGNNSGKDNEDDASNDGPVMNDDPTDDFTVTVTLNGEIYVPRMDIDVYWSDGTSLFTAPLGKDGVARIDGLDGDYRVTLSAVPNEYAYDPNAYIATNDDRNITLELYEINVLTGSGTGLYDCYKFSKTGVYSAVIENSGDAIYFEYAPDKAGEYSIESWVDVTADNINPYVDVYIGSSQWKQYSETKNDGGTVGSYTINFVHTVQIAKEMISSGGQATYTFVIRAESKNNKYPINITFAVKRDGDIELSDIIGTATKPEKSTAVSTFDFSDYDVADHEYDESAYALVTADIAHATNSSVRIFDDDMYKLWEKNDGGDGFYHLYDKEKYSETGGYGPILYAYITSACAFLDCSFNVIEYVGSAKPGDMRNAALTANGINYKHFIEGYSFLSTLGYVNGGSYYCATECTCHDAEKSVYGWACVEGCTECDEDCRNVPEKLVGFEGYQHYANSDGLVAVTEELKKFLSDYAYNGNYFNDGQGYIDGSTVGGMTYQAKGDSGWLFACCYYAEK